MSELGFWQDELATVAANAADESGLENLQAVLALVIESIETIESMGFRVTVVPSGQSMSHYVNADIAGDDACLIRISDHPTPSTCKSTPVFSVNVTDRFASEVAKIRGLRKRCTCCEIEAPLSARSCDAEKWPSWEFFV